MKVLVFITLLWFPVVDSIKITVTYEKNKNDEIKLETTDTSICARYNAYYVTSNYLDAVTCRCGPGEMFFYDGETSVSPKCRDENYGELYGCPCRTSTCTHTLKDTSDTSVNLVAWNFYESDCYKYNGQFNAKMLNEKGDARTTHHDDFKMEHSVATKEVSTFTLRWASLLERSYSYAEYEGRILKFGISCGPIQNHCFVLKGLGSHTMYIDDIVKPTSTLDANSSTKSSSSSTTIIIVVLSIVCVIIIVMAIIVCWKKKYCQTERKVTQPSVIYQPNVAPQPTSPYPPQPPAYDNNGNNNNSMVVQPPPYIMQPPLPANVTVYQQPAFAPMQPMVVGQPYVIQQSASQPSSIRQGLRTAGQVAGVINDVSDISEAVGNLSGLGDMMGSLF